MGYLDDIADLINGQLPPPNTPDTEAGKYVQMPEGWYSETLEYYTVPEGTKVASAQKVATVYAVSDGAGNTIPIPKEFYYVGGDISTGIVISDDKDDRNKYAGKNNEQTAAKDVGKDLKGNQFVWIPCSAGDYHKIDWNHEFCTWNRETPESELTQIEKYGGFYIGRYEAGVEKYIGEKLYNSATSEWTSYVTFTDGTKLSNKVNAQTGYNSWTKQNKSVQARSSYMTTLLGSDKGANKATGNVIVQGDAVPYYHADYYTAVEMSRRLYKNKSSVSSGLVTGTMWDMMIKYMQDHDVVIKGENCTWGNYPDTDVTNLTGYYTGVDSSGNTTKKFETCSTLPNKKSSEGKSAYVLLSTGSSENVKKMNIYDVAGNLWEWTDEQANHTESEIDLNNLDYMQHVVRGGGFKVVDATRSAGVRSYNYALNSQTDFGFRVALYIK